MTKKGRPAMSVAAGGGGSGTRLLLAAACLFLILLGAYGNHFRNSFHFDDAHTIVNNTAIRKVGNIPAFFRNATTFSVLPSNQSYRPLVTSLLAIDYWLGSGLDPLWFHCSIFAAYIALLILFALVIKFLLEAGERGSVTSGPSDRLWWIALTAVALYALHPANADTINYVIASAEVLSTLGVMASFALYFAFPRCRPSFLFVLPAAVCILAKPPAAIFAALFALYRLLFPPNDSGGRAAAGTSKTWSWLLEIVPPLVLCAALVWFVQSMTPHTWVAGARSSHDYLLTQPYVFWRYVRTFFWPSDLSADYDLNPFSAATGSRFWFGCGFTAVFVITAVVFCCVRRFRVVGFGLAWFLIALLPTSLFPLAEVMNDHRTFIAYPGLVIALAGAAAILFERSRTVMLRPVVCAVMLFGISVSAYATFQRNKAWRDEATLWRDVTEKSPRNGRGLMNYGLTLMAKGDFDGALGYFRRAEVFTPQYPYLFVNFAIAEDAIGQQQLAEAHFREAVRLAPGLPDAYSFYARFLIKHARQAEAQPLLRKASELSPSDEMVRDLMTEASVFSAQSYLNESLQYYREKRFDEALAAARKALEMRPGYAEAWNNIGAAYNDLGQFDKAAQACREALKLRPDFSLARNNLRYAEERLNTPVPQKPQ